VNKDYHQKGCSEEPIFTEAGGSAEYIRVNSPQSRMSHMHYHRTSLITPPQVDGGTLPQVLVRYQNDWKKFRADFHEIWGIKQIDHK